VFCVAVLEAGVVVLLPRCAAGGISRRFGVIASFRVEEGPMARLRRRLLFNLITNRRLEQGVRRSPTLQRRAYAAARRYVAGETVQDLLQAVASLRDQGIAASVDFFGELVADPAAAERATADYVQLATTLAQVQDAWLAIDLSHIGLDVSVDRCRRHLATIVAALPAGRWIQVGAEDTSRTDPILQVVTALAAQGRR
jgi:proline dehydrogenase